MLNIHVCNNLQQISVGSCCVSDVHMIICCEACSKVRCLEMVFQRMAKCRFALCASANSTTYTNSTIVTSYVTQVKAHFGFFSCNSVTGW